MQYYELQIDGTSCCRSESLKLFYVPPGLRSLDFFIYCFPVILSGIFAELMGDWFFSQCHMSFFSVPVFLGFLSVLPGFFFSLEFLVFFSVPYC